VKKENIILISVFSLAAVSILAYLSMPMFSGNSPESGEDITSVEEDIEEVRNGIMRTAEQKENSTLSTDFPEETSISINSENDFVQVRLLSEKPVYTEEWSLINGTTLLGTSLGEGEFALDDYDRQSIIAARTLPDGASVYHIEFREMRSESTISLVDIRGNSTIEDPDELRFQYLGSENNSVGASSGERLSRISSKVRITSY